MGTYYAQVTVTDGQGSIDNVLLTIIVKYGTTTTLKASVNPSVHGQAVTFTATVMPRTAGVGTPTGTVDFKDGAADLTPRGVSLVSGVATFSTSTLTVGTHTITASYGSDAKFLASISAALMER